MLPELGAQGGTQRFYGSVYGCFCYLGGPFYGRSTKGLLFGAYIGALDFGSSHMLVWRELALLPNLNYVIFLLPKLGVAPKSLHYRMRSKARGKQVHRCLTQ